MGLPKSVSQSVNQSINQSINQSVGQSINGKFETDLSLRFQIDGWFIIHAILITLVGTEVVFSAPSMLVFGSGHVRSKKINTGMEGADGRSTTFCRNMGTARGVPT